MISPEDILAFLLTLIIILFGIKMLFKFRQGDEFKARLDELAAYKENLLNEEESNKNIYQGFQNKKFSFIINFVEKIQRSGNKEQKEIKKLFVMAGFSRENAPFLYGISKLLTSLTFGGLAAVIILPFTDWSVLYKIMSIIGGALLGSYLVDFTLNRLMEARQDRIRKHFPAALDLMVICAEAGLSLTATVQRVAQEIAQISPDLGYELALLSIELNMFSDRQKALQNFSDRLNSPSFKAIVSNIKQSEQYGTPIAETMRIVSEQFRQQRFVEAEERANKLPVLLSLPMMLFIFPCIYIFIVGPAIISVVDKFL